MTYHLPKQTNLSEELTAIDISDGLVLMVKPHTSLTMQMATARQRRAIETMPEELKERIASGAASEAEFLEYDGMLQLAMIEGTALALVADWSGVCDPETGDPVPYSGEDLCQIIRNDALIAMTIQQKLQQYAVESIAEKKGLKPLQNGTSKGAKATAKTAAAKARRAAKG